MHPLTIFTILALLRTSTTVAESTPKSKVDRQLMRQSLFYGLVATAAEEPLKNTCMKQLTKTANGVLARNRWAIKMLDASGVPAGRLYFGGTYWIGNKALCDAAANPKNVPLSEKKGSIYKETVKDIPPFPLAYFAAYFQHHSNLQMVTHIENEFRVTWSMCLPKSCDGPELSELLQKYFNTNVFFQQFIYNTTYEMEEVKKLEDDYSWLSDTKIIMMETITTLFIVLCIAGTIYDVNYYQPMLRFLKKPLNNNNNDGEVVNLCKNMQVNGYEKDCKNDQALYQNGKINLESLDENLGFKIIRCFSVYSNHRSIFSSKSEPDALLSIHGIRLFSMIYVIIAHAVLFMQEFFGNKLKYFFMSNEPHVQLFTQAAFAVDTFFCISGLIFGYGFFTTSYQENSKKKYSLPGRIYLFAAGIGRRFLRIMPSYTYTLFIAEIVALWRFRVIPFWSNERNDLICPNYWWRNFLFINNLYPRSEMCLAWSWYLSVDMQFFVVFNFILVLSTMYFKAAASLLGALFFGSMAYTVNLVYRKNFIPYLNETYLSREDFYDNPIARVGPFIVGIVGGYILYYYKRTLPLKRPFMWLGWIISCSITCWILFGTANRDFTLTGSAAYVSLSRTLWAMSSCWLIIACETGNAGIIGKILSYKLWYPYSRLSFVAYLINPIIIFSLASFTDAPFEVEISNLIVTSSGFILITYFVSYIVTLMIESPNICLTKILFNYIKKREKRTKVIQNNDLSAHKLISEKSENVKITEELKLKE